ncbi:MAG: hypothetical protein IKW49_02000 [Opitutales bacterium]|nr:hypothetical protein [Opitutales bacterium]
MDKQKSVSPQDNLPRMICAFAAFFTFAVPALAIAAGIVAHPVLVELATRVEMGGIHDALACGILDCHRVSAWALLIIAAVLSVWVFGLMRRNKTAGTLSGGGRIVFALGFSGMFSAFYLCALLTAAGRLLLPLLR